MLEKIHGFQKDSRLRAIRNSVYRSLTKLEVDILPSSEPLSFAEMMSSQDWRTARRGMVWGKKLGCAWLRLRGDLPTDLSHPVILVRNSGEGLVYSSESVPFASLSDVWVPRQALPASGAARVIRYDEAWLNDSKIELYIDCGYNGFMMLNLGLGRFHSAVLAECREDIRSLYYDYMTVSELLTCTPKSAQASLLRDALRSSWTAFARGDISSAQAALQNVLSLPSDQTLSFSAIGHGHLDLAWMWPLRETIRKAGRTYTNALEKIARYPNYIFGASQPQLLAWTRRHFPSLYEHIRSAAAAGRIEPQGAFWVECDCNLSGGEALIRQAVYGQRFWREEFGREIELCWLPDAFGFSASLPQILRGCGMRYFSTIKLAWNKVNIFPHRTFFWRGIDGSEVLVHMPPEGDYNSSARPAALLRSARLYPEQETGQALLVYGAGDGGGGPQETHLEFLSREKNLIGLPKVRHETALEFFHSLEKADIKHVYEGELYLETHQGTYTTQALNKKHNRLCERLLHELEFFCVAAKPFGFVCPRAELDELWQEVLLYQFHDILPGSSITRVNTETVAAYLAIEERIAVLSRTALAALEQNKDARLVFINSTGFSRTEFVRHEDAWYSVDVPPYAAAEAAPANDSYPAVSADAESISNGLITLRFSRDGSIYSCKDAQGGELCGSVLNRLVVWRDRFEIPFNAWDIDQKYYKRRRKILRATSQRYMTDGPCAIRENVYRFGKSEIRQRIVVTHGSDLVRCETEVDWHEKHRMLRAEFFPADYGDTARFEIQFGHISRATTERDSLEAAQFEVCAQRWAATGTDGRGFALLNDCKYGHRVKNGLISLNLLRAPTFPDKHADRGRHTFSYAFCPFADRPEADGLGKVIAEAYRLNAPLRASAVKAFDSVARLSGTSSGVIIETVKPAESCEGVVLRLYESLGRTVEAGLETSIPYSAAVSCDMLENQGNTLNLHNVTFRPFEIKTILLKQEKNNA